MAFDEGRLARKELELLMKCGGKDGPENTWFHKKIIFELCNDTVSVEVILTGFLLSRFQDSKEGSGTGRSAANPFFQGKEADSKSGGEATEEEKKQDGVAKRLQMQQLPKHYDPRSYY